MDYGLSRLYGVWYVFTYEPTWWTDKDMGYKGVSMGYISRVWITRESTVPKALSRQTVDRVQVGHHNAPSLSTCKF